MTSVDPATVNATALEGAFDFVSAGAPCENGASMCMDTGRLSWTSSAVDVEEEALPADLATSDRSIEVPQPHKNDLGLDRDLGLECAAQELPGDHEAVEDCLRRTGAYGRFKRRRAGDGVRT